MTDRYIIRAAAVLGATAVGAAAFGAHALAETLSEARLDTWETAARLQLVHAVALLALVAAPVRRRWPAGLWVFGTVVFSGALYALCLTDVSVLGAITPIGGLALIAGWAALLTPVDASPSELT